MATPAVPTVLKGEPVDWEAFKLLPALLDTLQSIRISEDKDGIQVSKNIKALISRIELCSQILKALPSGDHTDEEKESEINALQEKLKEKCDMISKYQNLPAMNYENFIKEGPVSL